MVILPVNGVQVIKEKFINGVRTLRMEAQPLFRDEVFTVPAGP